MGSTAGFVVVGAASFAVMEPITALVHRTIMHGFGRALHRSHHRNVVARRSGGASTGSGWEANDAYPFAFAAIVMIGLAVGFNVAGYHVLVPIGVGITAYGAAYALVHDVYTHGRLPLFGDRRVRGFERLAAAHREHHLHNGAPYGMLVPVLSRSGSRPSHDPLDA